MALSPPQKSNKPHVILLDKDDKEVRDHLFMRRLEIRGLRGNGVYRWAGVGKSTRESYLTSHLPLTDCLALSHNILTYLNEIP